MGDSIVNKLQKELDGLISKSKEERKKTLDKIEELLRGHFGVQPQQQQQQQQPSKLIPSERNILEPENEDEIVSIVKDAYKNSKIVRVIGANHSWDRTISDPANTKSVVLISLTKLRGVEIDESKGTATAWAGTNIGRDPQNKDSTLENSLVYQLDQRGYALPELGGIIHQTIGGFISTGSAGGSIFHSFSEAIIHIRLIDGTGNIHDLKEDEPKFLAAGVSMGLLGIITKVTFKLEKKFYVIGSQTISKIDNNSPVDFFGDGDSSRGIPSIYDFLSNKKIAEYSRILWWPQYKVDLMSVWKANPTYVTLVEKPLEELPEIKQFFARLALIFINIADYNDEFKDVIATILNYFQQVGVQNFQDLWWKSLPMDNEIDDNILPVAFAELWMPLEDTKSVMNRLNKLFTDEPKSIGNFFSEIYTAKKSRFWLSPSYVGNVVRVDVNYFLGDVCGTPEEHYQYYWNALKDFKFRCHWGKYTPEDYGEHVKELYSSKYQDWMDIRKEMDPKQIFVTPYWRNRLSIPPLQ